MGAKLVALPKATTSPLVNQYGGESCKTDADCIKERKVGVDGSTTLPALTETSVPFKASEMCCMHH